MDPDYPPQSLIPPAPREVLKHLVIFNKLLGKARLSSNVIQQAQNVGWLRSYPWAIFIFLWLFFNSPHAEMKGKGFHCFEWEETFADWELSWKWVEVIPLNPSESQFPDRRIIIAEWRNYFSSWCMSETRWEHEIHVGGWTFWLKNILLTTHQRTPVSLTLSGREKQI